MAALERDQVASLNDIWLREVLELDILILQVKVAQLSASSALATCGSMRIVPGRLTCRVLTDIIDHV